MLGLFLELETNLRREIQLEGIKSAKEKRIYKGCKKNFNVEQIKILKKEVLVEIAIARQVVCHKDSFYRLLKMAKF